ncbi:MAG: hypothetical protein ACJA2M_000616 [Polaribacter sp.]|jgi:hypothetical protein
MKKQFILFLIIVISFKGFSQIKYEKGYYIDNNNKKVDVLIKNIDWLNNPKEFQYIIDDNSESQNISINSVKEFGIYGVCQYVRANVYIDKSRDYIGSLSTSKKPEFKEELVFLRVRILGKVNLYVYAGDGPERFFYNTKNAGIKQLIYKRYKINNNQIKKNNAYKQELFTNLKCQSISINDMEKINYNEKELSNLFVKYNECENALVADFNNNNGLQSFHLNIRPGINISSNEVIFQGRVFDKSFSLGYRIGIEAEFNLNFNKNKWAIFIEPNYQQLKYSKTAYGQNMSVDYKSIELPLGIRHYIFLNKESSKLYLNLLYAFNLPLKSKITFENNADLEIIETSYLNAGIGYKYKNKYIAEIRLGFNRDPLESDVSWTSNLNTVSIILGYSIF